MCILFKSEELPQTTRFSYLMLVAGPWDQSVSFLLCILNEMLMNVMIMVIVIIIIIILIIIIIIIIIII